jgi:hypothetical protein
VSGPRSTFLREPADALRISQQQRDIHAHEVLGVALETQRKTERHVDHGMEAVLGQPRLTKKRPITSAQA